MTSQRTAATPTRGRAQGHILQALAGGNTVLTGTLDRLGQRFGLPPEVVRICLLELLDAGWVSIDVRLFGCLEVYLEQHPRAPRPGPSLPIH